MKDIDELAHFGVKGMRWGVRKADDAAGYHLRSEGPTMEPGFNKNTKAAITKVSSLISERYGYQIKQVKTLGPGHPEFPGTLAYVENLHFNKGATAGTIFVQKKDLNPPLKGAEASGWMAPGTGNAVAMLTHESSHSLLHSELKPVNGFTGPKRVGPNAKALDKAMKAALKETRRTGVWSPVEVSGYAKTAGSLGELEAELFTSYHWGTNPPSYVKAWGEALHKEMGVDPTPFKDVK